MANPQKENGYTAISNEIMEALAKTRISGEARQVLDFILRKTYGFNKKEDRISLSQFYLGTGLKIPNVCRALNHLLSMNLIIKSDSIKGVKYRFNKNFEEWRLLSKTIDTLKNDNQPTLKNDNRLLSKTIDTKVDITKVNNTKVDIISQADGLLRQFSNILQEKIKVYIERNRLKNKSKTLTEGRRLTLLMELWNSKQRCADDEIFSYAMEMSINYDAPNIGYINAVIKNKKGKVKG